MSAIISKVNTLLQKKGYSSIISPKDDNIIFLSGLNFQNASDYTLNLVGIDASKDTDTVLLSQTGLAIRVPLEKREKILSFINMLNKDSWFTWFAINMEDGGIICRSCIRSKSNDAVTDDILEPWLFSSVGMLDGAQPFLMKLIYSEKTVNDAMKEINQPKKDA
jgi:hypothetical protein